MILLETRHALRRLRHAPGYSFAAVLMLAIGIALSVAMLGVVRGVLLGALPYPDSDRIVVLRGENPAQGAPPQGLTPAEAERLAGSDAPFAAFAAYTWGGISVFDGEHPREIPLLIAGPGLLDVLRLQPVLGRWFSADEHRDSSDAIVLAWPQFQQLFAGDPAAIGRTLDTSDGPMRVIGVLPPGATDAFGEAGAIRPLRPMPADQPWYRFARFVQAVARLPDDGSVERLPTRLAAVSAELRRSYALPDDGWQIDATPMLDVIVGDVRAVLWGAFGLALLVLLIACANVAILVDARQVAARHVQALTQALGASRARLYAGMLLELALLGAAALLLGCLFAQLGIDGLRELARDSLPRVEQIRIDGGVLALASLLALLLPLLTVLAGSLRLRGHAADAIRGGARGVLSARQRHRRWLPALGIALSTVSLVAAAALLLSLWRLARVDPGYQVADRHALLLYRLADDDDARRQFATAVLERLRAAPGIEAAALASDVPLSPHGAMHVDLQVAGRAQAEPGQLLLRRVGSGYLDLLGVPLLAGRGIAASDRADSEPVAVINRTLARQLFGDRSPLGERLGLPLGNGPRIEYRIVGVMADQHNAGPRLPAEPELLVPFAQAPYRGMTFVARSRLPAEAVAAAMQAALWQVDPRQAVSRQFTLAEPLAHRLRPTRFFVRTIGVFAAAALLLAAFGVHAVASLQQRQRLGEFGLRLALGAPPASLRRQLLGDALRTVVLGALAGLLGAWFALRLLSAQLFGVGAGSPWPAAFGILVLAASALLAAWWPARRAARVDPMAVLREQ